MHMSHNWLTWRGIQCGINFLNSHQVQTLKMGVAFPVPLSTYYIHFFPRDIDGTKELLSGLSDSLQKLVCQKLIFHMTQTLLRRPLSQKVKQSRECKGVWLDSRHAAHFSRPDGTNEILTRIWLFFMWRVMAWLVIMCTAQMKANHEAMTKSVIELEALLRKLIPPDSLSSYKDVFSVAPRLHALQVCQVTYITYLMSCVFS